MLTKEDVGELAFRAADCNHDEIIDGQDVWILNEAGAILAEVNQTGESYEEMYTSSAYAEYVELIDQTPEAEELSEEDVIEIPEKEPLSLIEFIISLIKKFFDTIFSFVM